MGDVENELRTLVVMRHARTAASGPSDIERELMPSGVADAVGAGEWLRRTGIDVDHALVSAAVRTRQTWEHVSAAAGFTCDCDVDSSLYSAGPEAALDILRLVPDSSRGVLLLGHNPTVAHLAQLLSDGLGDPGLLADMTRGYPPAALTVLQFSGDWSQLGFGDARVTGFHVARG